MRAQLICYLRKSITCQLPKLNVLLCNRVSTLAGYLVAVLLTVQLQDNMPMGLLIGSNRATKVSFDCKLPLKMLSVINSECLKF